MWTGVGGLEVKVSRVGWTRMWAGGGSVASSRIGK